MRHLQSGATAHVYACTDWEGDTDVGFVEGDFAVKVHRADCDHARMEARRELAALQRLKRSKDEMPFVVKLHFVDNLCAAVPIFGFELCSGGDLFDLFRYGPLSEKDTAHYAVELASAISHLHATNIMHTDIKPENIGLSTDGHLRLFDLGSARILEDDEPIELSSGTLHYASPEVLLRRPCGYAADWWSFGVIMFEMMFGVQAFYARSQDEVVDRIVHVDLDLPLTPHRSAEAVKFVTDILKFCPEERLQSLRACCDHPFLSQVDLDLVMSETWVPIKYTYVCFEQDKTPLQEVADGSSKKPKSFF
ncbi:Protein kinase, putative [Hondaea fermentalgiana]|uniref:non-specific serine/threonine protein kinase n=1 Tax=Hondaea fermentalgiana TaxID=2315210 RepID=A0A2R5GG11_9STRA|nr:Protein kinase, putative [Hondaea fermentalgiana]|eukprot:GBG29535.1 Protein kinase, putative [Hondaea fermentalgiana]